jgi:hypothetical protein
MDERVEVVGGQVKLMAGTRTLDSAPVREIRKLVWAFPADALFHGDETYYVAFLPDRVWVIPYFTRNTAGFLEAVATSLAGQSALVRAEISGCPVRWRSRVLGFIPLFPTPALGSHPLDTVPELHNAKPTSIGDLLEGGSTHA